MSARDSDVLIAAYRREVGSLIARNGVHRDVATQLGATFEREFPPMRRAIEAEARAELLAELRAKVGGLKRYAVLYDPISGTDRPIESSDGTYLYRDSVLLALLEPSEKEEKP